MCDNQSYNIHRKGFNNPVYIVANTSLDLLYFSFYRDKYNTKLQIHGLNLSRS